MGLNRYGVLHCPILWLCLPVPSLPTFLPTPPKCQERGTLNVTSYAAGSSDLTAEGLAAIIVLQRDKIRVLLLQK
jgi:hypothetical protein